MGVMMGVRVREITGAAMRRLQYRLSTLLAACFIVAILGGWLHDHRRLRANLDAMRADNEEAQRLKAELSSAKSGHANACLEFHRQLYGPFRRLTEPYATHSEQAELLRELRDLGVHLETDQQGDVVFARVPDTTNFKEAFGLLKAFPTLRFVFFCTGPLPPGYNWNSPEFRRAYADAANRVVMRTFIVSGHFRRDAYAELRRQLPHIEAIEWPGAF
jgi:hypothetical protein